MHLYSLTLQRAQAITHAVQGCFSGTKETEIAVSRGKILELLKPDTTTGKVVTLVSIEVFGIIRSMMAFRLTGGSKDYLVVGSDSGRIVILEYNVKKKLFDKVHQETFGKSGCRRIVPGQYLAVDPKGRAVMISAIEKQKLVYILNRDSQARLTISSPLEAHKSNTFVYCTVGVDVGFDNPMFACLEIEYDDEEGEDDEDAGNEDAGDEANHIPQQTLSFYELDLGLNHVVRKYSEPLDEHANHLIAVPGGNDGPSGVIICSPNFITYKNFGDQPDIRCPIPRRRNDLSDDDSNSGIIIVASACHRTKTMFFFLLQTEQGDILKVTLDIEDETVTEIKVKYFDTVSVATNILILKTGFLFIASEFGNHALYQISSLGDNEDEAEFSSSIPLQEGETFLFVPRGLRNLVMVDELVSLSPAMDMKVSNIHSVDSSYNQSNDTAIIVVSGRGSASSSLRLLRHGLQVSEMAVSELPGSPNSVWSIKKSASDEFDSYIVLSFSHANSSATLVLSIGETVEEVTDSGFLGTTNTLSCAQIGDHDQVQVYPEGIRHIRQNKRVNEWRTPAKKHIVKSAVNQRQVVIALTGGTIVYFEMDSTGQLNEYTDRKDMNANVICMSLANVPEGEQRTRFLAIALDDNTIRIVSLDPSTCLTPLSMQALPGIPESVCLSRTLVHEAFSGGDSPAKLYLNVGLQNGVLLRTVLDSVSGDLSDTRTRYLGTKPVKLFSIQTQGTEAVLAISSRSWLLYYHQSRFHLTPLSYSSLEYASGFMSEQCPEGIVAIAANTLRILALEKLGGVFNETSFDLLYTPRKFAVHPESGNIIVIESDHNSFTQKTLQSRREQMAEEMVAAAAGTEEEEAAAEMAAEFLTNDYSILSSSSKEKKILASGIKAGTGEWASLIRLVDPVSGSTLHQIELEQKEAALSLCYCKLSSATLGEANYLLVGVARNMILAPRSVDGGSIHTYQVQEEGKKLQLMHVTLVEEVPHAITAIQGRVAVSVGNRLRIYEVGKKMLLKKCENKTFPSIITAVHSFGSRLFVSTVSDSVFFVRYKRREESIIVFADDTFPRYTTCLFPLDYGTVCVADKFGNVSVLRLPPDADDDSVAAEDATGFKSLWDRGTLGGTSCKLDLLCNYYVGETITCIQKTALVPGLNDCIVYATLSGCIGILVPLSSTEDRDFFEHLEMHLREENSPLLGRDHLSFRSYYSPSKAIIDGDLCEQYNQLDYNKQKNIAEQMERLPAEISKKLEDIRTQFAF